MRSARPVTRNNLKILIIMRLRSIFLPLLFASVTFGAWAQPMPHRVDKAPAEATLIPVSSNWQLDGDVPVHATILSLQGLANRDYPRIYLEYPDDWQWEIAKPLIGFLETHHGVRFERLGMDDVDAALKRYAKFAKGYVVWDKELSSASFWKLTSSPIIWFLPTTLDLKGRKLPEFGKLVLWR